MFSNAQLIDAVIVNVVVRPRFLTAAGHDYYLVDARPVGGFGIRVGATGRPTPHPATGENRQSFGSKPRRDAAAGLPGVERAHRTMPAARGRFHHSSLSRSGGQ